MLLRFMVATFLVLFAFHSSSFAAHGPKALLDSGEITPSSDQVTFTKSDTGVLVTIQPGKEGYPGITIKPADGLWDLSSYGHIEAQVVNSSDKPVSVGIRVDDDGDWQKNPWNSENLYLKAGATGKGRVYFGYSYGKPGYALKANSVARVLVFAGKSDAVQTFRVELLQAGGVAGEGPPVDPNSVRTKPVNGVLLGEGSALAEAQVATRGDNAVKAQLSAQGKAQSLRITLPADKPNGAVLLKPAVGRWDMRQYLEVRVKVRNDGQAPITPRFAVESNGGASDRITSSVIAPGASHEVVIPFASASVWNGDKTSGSKLASDAVSGVAISAEDAPVARTMVVESITAGVPEIQIPDWLGKRPPVDGDWAQTFTEEFDGKSFDPAKWSFYGANFWDKQSHFSKDNTLIGDGTAKLRFEKKRGHQNDDPTHERVTDYATGFLDTYGKWVQRYGYFEARQKLPSAQGLWPAFWMMPDRGVSAGPQWKRQSTSEGGMEFDILEHLTRWGPYRYNIAMHWDGYGKDHKSTGSEKIYFQPDKDGFVTSGLLWTPGSMIFYCNGQEVARYTNERVSSVASNLMFTLPMGGWDNSPLVDAELPADYVIDYVRVWQRKDLASDVDGFIPGGKDYDGKDRK